MLSSNEICIRLILAALFGGIIGTERQRRDSSSGLRTHMLVCVGSTLVMIVSAFGFNDVLGKPGVVLDPSRVAAQVISGIGFLGAGTILLLRHEVVRGLTTAAGLWTVAAIGLAVGGGLYVAAMAATSLTFVILAVLKPIERKLFSSYRRKSIKVLFHSETSVSEILALFEKAGLHYMSLFTANASPDKHAVEIVLQRVVDKNLITTAVETIRRLPGVYEVSVKVEE